MHFSWFESSQNRALSIAHLDTAPTFRIIQREIGLLTYLLCIISTSGILSTQGGNQTLSNIPHGPWQTTEALYAFTDPTFTAPGMFANTKPCAVNRVLYEKTNSEEGDSISEYDTTRYTIDSFKKYFNMFGNYDIQNNPAGNYYLSDSLDNEKRNIALGAGLLAAEYIILPTIAYYTWWQEGFKWDNPLKYIGEKEPFLADNGWHMAGCNMLTELHYRIINNYFRSRHSVLWATSLTLVTFTAVECLDALEKTGKWEFSLGDAFANVLGVGFWTFKHYYPDTPVSIRVGIRKYGDVVELLEEAATAITDFSQFRAGDFDHYSILKVEGVYRFEPGVYCGVAISRKDLPSRENLWGITAGWDLVKAFQGSGNKNSLLQTISEYVSIPISLTYWLD
jgi:hypothetical protein